MRMLVQSVVSLAFLCSTPHFLSAQFFVPRSANTWAYFSHIADGGAAQQFFCNFRVGCGTGSSSLGSRVQKAVAREPLAVNLSKATSRSIKMRGRSSLHYSQRAIQRPHLLLQEKRPCQKPSEPRSRAAPYREPSLI